MRRAVGIIRAMGDEVDQRVRGNEPPPRDQMSLSWPLVERRRVHAAPPGGVERRAVEELSGARRHVHHDVLDVADTALRPELAGASERR